MADEQDVPPFLDHPLGLAVDLGHQRAGRIDIGQRAVVRGGGHRLGHAVGRKHHRAIVGHFVELVDEHRAEILQPLDDEAVVDDFVADIDRRTEPLERQLDDLDGAVDSGAKAARGRDQDLERRPDAYGSASGKACKPSLAGIEGPSYERPDFFRPSVRTCPREASPRRP